MKRIALALLLCLSTALAAGAQDAQRRIDNARRSAASAGLPVQLLEDKVAEGRAKGVPLDRIAAAVEHRLAGITRAREVMGRAVTPADLAAGADALDAGVSSAALTTLSREAPPAQRAVAVAVLTQLVSEGLASDRALERVQAALRRGPDALRELPAQTQGRGSAGAPPARGRDNARGRGGPPPSVPGGGGRGRGQGQGKGNTP
jgi:hypothetical protein